MIAVEVCAVRRHDSAAVAYVVDLAGTELAVAVPAELARDLASALALGRRPILEVEPWHVLMGGPGAGWVTVEVRR